MQFDGFFTGEIVQYFGDIVLVCCNLFVLPQGAFILLYRFLNLTNEQLSRNIKQNFFW